MISTIKQQLFLNKIYVNLKTDTFWLYILIEYVYLCMFSLQLHRGQIPNDILADIPQLLRLGLAQRQRRGVLDPTLGVVQARLFSYPRVYCTVDQSLGSHLWGF